MDKEALKDELRAQANDRFPSAARGGGYPVRFNHCFLRIVYDNLLGGKWQDTLPGKGPAIHRLSEEQLREATELGRRIIEDPALAHALNRKSLRFRGKLA